MNLISAQKLAMELMLEHGLIEKNWYFEFDNSKSRFGCCFYGKHKITLSKHLVSINSEERVKDTILHEIAHALVGHVHGHDYVWVRKAQEIGCDGKRCYTSEDTVVVEGPYAAECPGCKDVIYAFRRKKSTRLQSCGKCSPRFDRNYLLTFMPTVELKNQIKGREVYKMTANTIVSNVISDYKVENKDNSEIDIAEAKRLKRNEQSKLCKQRKKLGLIK